MRRSGVMANNNQKSGGGSTFLIIVVIVLILAGIGSCSGGGSSSSDSARCEVCGKTYTNRDDVHSIAWRNMCERCYSNYKYSQDLKDEINKYNERYGN